MGTFINPDLFNAVQMTRKRRVGDPDAPTQPTDTGQSYPGYQDDMQLGGQMSQENRPPILQPNAPLRPGGSPAVEATASTPGMDAVAMPTLPGTNEYSQFPAGPAPQNPDIPVEPHRTDAQYNQQFSRKRGFVEGLMRGLSTGNPLAGVIEGGIGAASKRIGGDLAFQHDFNNYAGTRMTQLKLEDADPNLRHQLQMDTLNQQMNNIITRGTITNQNNMARDDNKAGNTQEAIKARGDQALKVAQLRGSTQKEIADMRIKAKQAGDLPGLTQLYQAKGYDDITSKALATDDLLERNSATIEKLWNQGDQAAAGADRSEATADLTRKKTTNPELFNNRTGNGPSFADREDIKTINNEIAGLGRQRVAIVKNKGMSEGERTEALKDIDAKVTDANTRKATRMQQVGGQSGGTGLTPQQDADYKARKAKYPSLTVQQYLDIMNKIK